MRGQLQAFEAGLDPAHPRGAQILAYGEISAALLLPQLPGHVVKRMAGFTDDAAARAYCRLVADYVAVLGESGIAVVDTETVTIARDPRPPVVYLVQPLMSRLGTELLTDATDAELSAAIHTVMDRVLALHRRDHGPEVAVDAQLSNWSFTDPDEPVLLDVGTPFMRSGGVHQFDFETVLSAVPPGIRAYYRRAGIAQAYMDDYYEPRTVAVDLLGNFIKEGARLRLAAGLDSVNAWLAPHRYRSVDRTEVEQYYKRDAATLELFLRVRRIDRAVRRILRRDYDFILPGRVSR